MMDIDRMTPTGGDNGAKRKFPKWLIPLAGYAVSIACLIWVYKGFDWHEELLRIKKTNWKWVTVAVAADILIYIVQGVRWNVLLRPVGRLPVWKSVQAIYIGLFANEIFPFRPGEVIRCFLQAHWAHIHFSVSLSSAVIERLLDGVWLILGFYTASFFVKLPEILLVGSWILAALLAIIAGLFVLAVYYHSHARRIIHKSRWADELLALADAMYAMANSPSFYGAIALSLLYFLLQVIPIWAVMRGYDLDLSLGAAAVVLVMLRLGSIPPQMPGNVGTFQALAVAGVRLFGYDKAEATGFATLLFVVVTTPLWIGGFIALTATRMKLDDIRTAAKERK
jgi:uncharacterized protein (TIRG00374 family)